MALKPKIDAKSTYHITLTGEKALIMNAMILMFAAERKAAHSTSSRNSLRMSTKDRKPQSTPSSRATKKRSTRC